MTYGKTIHAFPLQMHQLVESVAEGKVITLKFDTRKQAMGARTAFYAFRKALEASNHPSAADAQMVHVSVPTDKTVAIFDNRNNGWLAKSLQAAMDAGSIEESGRAE